MKQILGILAIAASLSLAATPAMAGSDKDKDKDGSKYSDSKDKDGAKDRDNRRDVRKGVNQDRPAVRIGGEQPVDDGRIFPDWWPFY